MLVAEVLLSLMSSLTSFCIICCSCNSTKTNEPCLFFCIFCGGLTEKGELFGCGEMDNGKLGCDADADVDHFSPQRVNIFRRIISVSCGHNHTVAVTGQCSLHAHLLTYTLVLN